MKILLYGINFSPELTGIGKYTGEMAAQLAEAGHEVRVVTAPPYYPDWKIAGNYRSSRYVQEVWNGVQVWRAPLWVPGRPSGIKRLLHQASFALSSLPLMMRQLLWGPDVVWVVEPPLFCAPIALCVARLSGARAWLHVQDYEVDVAFALGLLKFGLARRLVTGLERWLMCRFDKVSSISESMIARASGKGVKADRLVYFPNWIDLKKIYPIAKPSSYRATLGIPDNTVVALYSGNMGGKQELKIMAEAARLLSGSPNMLFVFCGNGAGKADLERQTKGLRNVQFLNLQPLDCLNDLLGLADIHLLPQHAEVAGMVMPSKLIGMLASGRAVVATANGDTELCRVLHGCGLVTLPGDAAAFAEAIYKLASDATQRKMLGLAGRKYAETKFNSDRILDNFECMLEESRRHRQVSDRYL